MDAIALLKDGHANVKKMLTALEDTTERAVKTRQEGLAELKRELQIHEAIEEAVFYPALKQHAEAKEIVLEAYEEHDVVDTIMGEIERTPVEDERWGAKFKVMKENLEHHIEERAPYRGRRGRDVQARPQRLRSGDARGARPADEGEEGRRARRVRRRSRSQRRRKEAEMFIGEIQEVGFIEPLVVPGTVAERETEQPIPRRIEEPVLAG